ncbi:hypothetical protein BKA69DRAFT_1056346 [Paraphysoderma sedebokerense]|nr:hypothetical protein BKA69DRAFT_1056346 [Paraphysoderma sedebokerense]
MNVKIRLTKQDKLLFKKLNSIVHSNPSSDSDFNLDPKSTDYSNTLCCPLSSVFSVFRLRLERVAPPPSSPDSSIQHLFGKSQFTATTSSTSGLTMFSRFFDSLNTRLTHNLDESIQTGVFTIDQFKRVGISDGEAAFVEDLLKIRLEHQQGRCESKKGKQSENVSADLEIKINVERRLSMWRKLIGIIVCYFGSMKWRSSKVKAL